MNQNHSGMGQLRTEVNATNRVVRKAGRAAFTLVAFVLTACATTGSTLGSGVGERLVDRPPYYAGDRAAGSAAGLAHLPIAYQRGASQEPIFDPGDGPGSAVHALLQQMNAYLDSLGISDPLDPTPFTGRVPPDVRFGCERGILDECVAHEMDGTPWLKLSVGQPAAGWVAAGRESLDEAGAERILMITLEIDQYWPRQKNLLGSKEVRLGTAYTVGLPWLTALDLPVRVLQITGAIIDREGKAVRIGAEGLLPRRTNIVLSGFGIEELIGDDDIERIMTSRRADLPGSPLVWQVALTNLLAGLTGDPSLVIR